MLAFDAISHGETLVLLVCLSTFCHSAAGQGNVGELSAAVFTLENSCEEEAKRKGCVLSVILCDPLAGGMSFLRLL